MARKHHIERPVYYSWNHYWSGDRRMGVEEVSGMQNRERIIESLEQCTDTTGYRSDCYGCIHRQDGPGLLCREQLMRDALALLREQEPVKPTERDGWHYCGAYGRSIDSDFADEEVFLYCPNCGRKVEWDA